MPHRICLTSTLNDPRAENLRASLLSNGFSEAQIQALTLVDVYTVDKDFAPDQLSAIAEALSNPLTQVSTIDRDPFPSAFAYAIEWGYLPGVTDNVGNTARQIIRDLTGEPFADEESVYYSQIVFVAGDLEEADAERLSAGLINNLIQRLHRKSRAEFEADGGMDLIVPKVKLGGSPRVDSIDLNLSDDQLSELGKKGIPDIDPVSGEVTYRGPLALDLKAMKAIAAYFKKIGRPPTDAELEMLAQTWSEHCKHIIFNSPIDEIEEGLFRRAIKRATDEIRAKRGQDDICVSVFKDNAGAIAFDDNYLITDKVETHNSPSALDPYGGAITGIVGVNRDCLGFGLGARPIINRYGFCLADPEDDTTLYRGPDQTFPMLSARRIMEGVIAGVRAGGNESGIPAPQGFLYFDDCYRGKPLVFAGTVGLIPREAGGKKTHEKAAQPGDKIVMVGGRVGKDGIHGATFSSEALDTGSPVTAVQIGDPITQKKLSDAIVGEVRAQGLLNAITDNGAGGLSSSIGEMAEAPGGCHVQLEKVPVKYPGLTPWEIWISESQERMTLAVPPENVDKLMAIFARHDTEATVIGEFTDSGRCVVTYHDQPVVDLDLYFLHDGYPLTPLTTQQPKSSPPPTPRTQNPTPSETNLDLHHITKQLLQRPSIRSHAFVSYQYDHLVQGNAVTGPLHGPGQVNADAVVSRPLFDSLSGVITTQALRPRYAELDPYAMAAHAIDAAVRQVVAIGGNLQHLALQDNFCWCSSDDPERLWQLKQAALACYDTAVAYGTPYISGKDSMYNDFKGYDADGNPIKISIPPTLLISALGVMPDVTKAVTLDFKQPGDLIYLLGETQPELGGSEYLAYLGETERNIDLSNAQSIPSVDTAANRKLYETVSQAIDQRLLASSQSVGLGGLAVALAKSTIAGQLGATVIQSEPQASEESRAASHLSTLFSESAGRLLVSVAPANQQAFESLFHNHPCTLLGEVNTTGVLKINNTEWTLEELTKAYNDQVVPL